MGLWQSLLQRGSSLRRLPFDLSAIDNETFVDLSYKFVLRRSPDQDGKSHYSKLLNSQTISRNYFLNALVDSDEFSQNMQFNELGTSLHESRMRFIKSFPPAANLVDLGGSSKDAKEGALVKLGYPYKFNKVTIVDLPNDARHALYRSSVEENLPEFSTEQGTIACLYRSMCDLSPLASESVDLVYSGQSIEHVSLGDGRKTMAEVLRILKPGGYFCLDTPNGRITRVQQDAFIDPDHKIEYTHMELSTELQNAGFRILEAKGLNYAGPISKRSEFSPQAIAKKCGLYWDIENCYLLGYICQK